MACTDSVHSTHITAYSFTYNPDNSSSIFRFMTTFVPPVEAQDGFFHRILTRLSDFDECKGWRSALFEISVNGSEWERDHQWGCANERRQRRNMFFYSPLEAKAPPRQSHCLDWRPKRSPGLKSMLAFTKPCSCKQKGTWEGQPL